MDMPVEVVRGITIQRLEPYTSACVLKDAQYLIVAQPILTCKMLKMVTVIPVNTGIGREPHDITGIAESIKNIGRQVLTGRIYRQGKGVLSQCREKIAA